MNECETVEQLRKAMLDALTDGLLNASTKGDIQAILLEAIEEGVYNDYTPTMYERREEKGGLGDANLIEADVSPAPFLDGLDLIVTTSAKAAGKGNEGEDLDLFIVEGIYNWENSGIAKRDDPSRDFYALAEEKLQPKIERIIENELARLGIDTE